MATKLNYKKLLLIQFIGILHPVEEFFFGFSDWATRHFGTTTQNWYIASHIFIFSIFGIIAFYTYKGFKTGVFFTFMVQVLLFTNGLFHILTTIIWKEYSPGVITQLLVLPISYIVFRMIVRSHVLSRSEITYSTIIGCIISTLIIASLYINVPI